MSKRTYGLFTFVAALASFGMAAWASFGLAHLLLPYRDYFIYLGLALLGVTSYLRPGGRTNKWDT